MTSQYSEDISSIWTFKTQKASFLSTLPWDPQYLGSVLSRKGIIIAFSSFSTSKDCFLDSFDYWDRQRIVTCLINITKIGIFQDVYILKSFLIVL